VGSDKRHGEIKVMVEKTAKSATGRWRISMWYGYSRVLYGICVET
jgi:hypothetical protein